MALGILEPAYAGSNTGEHVPGTVDVNAQAQRGAELLSSHPNLKKSADGTKILIPQPSDDPNDPLNWPLWERDIILGILCFVAVIATTASPLLAADSTTLAILFKRTFQDAANLTAFHLLGVAVGGVIFVPSARVWGKRHLFLFGSLLMLASSAWGGATRNGYNYYSLVWARIFQGVALAPFEGLVNACVGDLYFVHERGPRMAFTNTCLFGGAFLTPVFVGMIAHTTSLGWQWSFYFMAIFMAPGFLLLLFFVPETAFRRAKSLDLDYLAEDSSGTSTPAEQKDSDGRASEEKRLHVMTVVEPNRPKKTLLQRMMPFDGRKTDESFFLLFLRPFPLFLHPAIAWACLMQGVIIGWTVMVGVILSVIFLGPPLFFNEQRAGNLYVSAFIGSVLGLGLSGVYTELTTNLMIRLNKGKYEPEFRLLLVIPCTVFAAVGLYGFGITAANVKRYGWLIPSVFIAFIIISMVMGAIASAQYILDAHRDIAVEAFTNLLIFKNIFSFLLAYKAYDWVFKSGVDRMFIIFASIEIGICALSIPMYVLGKRNRAFFHKHDILKMARLK